METKKVKNHSLISNLEKLHENEKLAKDLCCGLPLDIDQAKRIVSTLQADILSLAAVSSWLEALQESLDETIVKIAYAEHLNIATRSFVTNIIDSANSSLQSKMNAIQKTLKAGKEPDSILKDRPGASACQAPVDSLTEKETEKETIAENQTRRGASARYSNLKTSGITEWQP